MIDMTVARRYAKALLTLGKEDAHYKEYGEGLSGFAHLLEREPELKDALLNPIHGREDRNKLLLRMIELLQLPPMVSNLLQLLQGLTEAILGGVIQKNGRFNLGPPDVFYLVQHFLIG